jgi:tRNA-specific 2-thiouridylase
LCNQFIKFDLLLNEANKLGAAYLATGHYARLHRDTENRIHLMKGQDSLKDQSYFLFHLRPEELAQVMFPVGGMTKQEVRDAARKFGLNTHSKSESMEICFIPNNDHAQFIAKNYPTKRHGVGNFVDRSGHIIGQHEGIERYTIGQRRGLGMGFGQRMYVAEIRADQNEVVLVESDDIFHGGAEAERFYFTHAPTRSDFSAKVRHQNDEWPVKLRSFDGASQRVKVEFLEPARAITPGQALVLYDGDIVVGGGWIERSLSQDQLL